MPDNTHDQMTFSQNAEEMFGQLAELCSRGIEYLKDCYFEIGITDDQIMKLGELHQDGDSNGSRKTV